MLIVVKEIAFFRANYNKIVTNWPRFSCVRFKSSAEPDKKAYSYSIIFPKTNFPVRPKTVARDDIQKIAQFSDLYTWQRENLKGKEFILHDGPPYANGDLHMGHAVNKIIKDINNRSQVLRGNRVHYVPGWDCHGLPIELKALQKAKKTATKSQLSDPVNIRQMARAFALETVEKQKEAFKSWGIMADWENQFYLTLSNSYMKNQLRKFYELYETGLIFRALKPVYWSPSSRTALAEAELEYDPQFKSKQVYVTFPIEKPPAAAQDLVAGKSLQAIIWTTTPWTLVANRAICYGPHMRYSLVTLAGRGADELFIVGSELVDSLREVLGTEVKTVAELDGPELEGTTYRSRLSPEVRPLLPGGHVTGARGTGLVHTAPAHGPDDFLVALRHRLSVECNVDEAGRYTNLDPSLDGLYVLSEGQDAVLRALGDDVIHQGTYTHSYPLDWRTKKPVILRASQQWFIDTAREENRPVDALEDVQILPQASSAQYRQGFRSLLQKRPYWCISRQRAWGVPIPVLYHSDEPVVDVRIIDRFSELLDSRGPDVWWTCDVKDLLPEEVTRERGLDVTKVTKGKDIMDIWLDSGLSWSTVGARADLYSEGVDQLTGWFQAALLTALPLTRQPPYRSIFVHGFVVDDKKRKMSKSIGNVVDPTTIIHGGKDRQSQPAYGVDTLRWWVASHGTQHTQIVISKKLLDDSQQEVIRIRNILKYLLGVINDLEPDLFEERPLLNYLDNYMVKESYEFLANVKQNYDGLRYNSVTKSLLHFISNKVSSLYCHCAKDRLYCAARESNERIAAQLVAHTILVHLLQSLGPILPHLVEEAWSHHPLYEKPFFMTEYVPQLPLKSVEKDLMDTVLDLKRDICAIIKNYDMKKCRVHIKVDNDLFYELERLNRRDEFNESCLNELLEISSIDLEKVEKVDNNRWLLDVSQTTKEQCLRCRKYNALDCSDKCLRCENVVMSIL